MLYTFSVTPMLENHFEERVKDIADMVRRGTIYMPLFCMTLTPEGDPVWDKATDMCRIYARYRDALVKEGVDTGILVQASLGHGYDITPNPFQKYINLNDGQEAFVCCPEDEAFIEHFKGVIRKLAMEKPKAIMLDDDFRLMMRPGRGCACPYHMAEFNKRAGTDMTREQLYAHLCAHPKTDRLARIYEETQRDSLIKAATAFRAVIDEIDPTIQGINCTSGDICESVIYTNKIFAGKGNPTMVRVPNGSYAPITVRGFSGMMAKAAICGSRLKKHGIQIRLAETDTIPFNRYAKSSRHLHAHFAASMLDGLSGAKHWLTRTSAFEPASGKAYRDILAQHRGMYEKLADYSEEIRWVGINSAFVEQTMMDFGSENCWRNHDNYFITKNIERMGLPFFFSDEVQKASFFEGDLINDMTDEQIQAAFEGGSVFVDGEAAQLLCARGYGDKLGVNVSEWDLGLVTGELLNEEGDTCTKQKNLRKIAITDEKAQPLTWSCLRADGGQRKLAPAVTVLERAEGKISVVFCGSPNADFNYMEGFSFLNESRKAQLVSLLQRAGALPVYVPGDDEVCFRAGYLADGALLAAVFEMGVDPMEEIPLYLEKEPRSVSMILPDGSEQIVEFEKTGEDMYSVKARAENMYPVFLLIR